MMTTVREKNILLCRDDVGRAKPHTHDLPESSFTYGVANKKEEHGAGKLTTFWQIHSSNYEDHKYGNKDFRKLNRL